MTLTTLHLLAGETEEVVAALVAAELYQEPEPVRLECQPIPIRTQLRNLFHH